MELEYQCKETQDRSEKNDGRRIHQDVREVKRKEATARLVFVRLEHGVLMVIDETSVLTEGKQTREKVS